MVKNYYVVQYDAKWAIIEEDSQKLVSIFNTQEEALEEAMRLSLPSIYHEKMKKRIIIYHNKENQRPS